MTASPRQARRASPGLTPRERECLQWAALGKTCWETAKIIGISQNTVNFHRQSAIARLGATCLIHAVAIAVAEGFIDVR